MSELIDLADTYPALRLLAVTVMAFFVLVVIYHDDQQ